MKQIRVVIVDDEPLARENMHDLLAAYPEVIVVGEAGTVEEARQILIKVRPDAVFLDIQMPGGTGFDVLSGLDLPLQVVFVTAYDAFAIRAFQVNAIDYLLKPIDRTLLAGAVQRLTADPSSVFAARVEEGAETPSFTLEDQILIRQDARYSLVPLQSICVIRAYRNYTEVIDAHNHTYLLRQPMKDWSSRLPIPPFLRLDRSLIIHTGKVSSWRAWGRRLQVAFQDGNVTLHLGRIASERFRKFVDEKALAKKRHQQPDAPSGKP